MEFIMSNIDSILWYCLWGIHVFTFALILAYTTKPAPWGKFHHLESFYWTNISDTNVATLPMSIFTVIMEAPAVVYPFIIFPYGKHGNNPKAWLLMAPYVIHYMHRGFVYPFWTNRKHIMPIRLWLLPLALWLTFTIAGINAREISHYHDYDNDTWYWLRVCIGFPMFLWGFHVRVRADDYLTALKGEDGKYKIPRGWWFELIDCPHYVGELTEWFAWFIMTGHLCTFRTFTYVFVVLESRARHIHNWYLETFEDYPKSRKRLIPYIW